MACIPKEKGGWGLIDIEKQNEVLLLKNLHKFFHKMDIPWVQMIWEKHYRNGKLSNHVKKGLFGAKITSIKSLSKFKELAIIESKNGSSIFFWQDN